MPSRDDRRPDESDRSALPRRAARKLDRSVARTNRCAGFVEREEAGEEQCDDEELGFTQGDRGRREFVADAQTGGNRAEERIERVREEDVGSERKEEQGAPNRAELFHRSQRIRAEFDCGLIHALSLTGSPSKSPQRLLNRVIRAYRALKYS